MTDKPRRKKLQPTADEMRARIESQRQTIELMAEEIRVLNSHLRIKDAAIDKLRRPWWAKVAAFLRGLRYPKQAHEKTP